MRDRLPLIFSTTALVAALLGTTPLGEAAYDAALPRNSVGTLQLKRNAVTSAKIAPNTIRGSQVVDGSLLTGDFKAGQIPQGPKGDKGDRGPAGPSGISGYEIVTASKTVAANTTLFAVQPTCPAGKKVLGGTQTAQGIGNTRGVFFATSVINSSTIYSVTASNTNTTPRTIFASAICARVTE